MAEPLWAGRLEGRPSSAALAFQSSFPVDSRMLLEDIQGSLAHAEMLGKTGIIPPGEAEALKRGLEALRAEAAEGRLALPEPGPDYPEDVHSFVEALLTARLGDTGKRLHTARSRNDQVALDARLYLSRRLSELEAAIRRTLVVLSRIARAHVDSVMPGYTHLQRAQPVSLGYHLAAWCAMLMRDHGRLSDARRRAMDECPLGSGALAGTTFPIDREMTARALGFRRPSLNAMDAVADRDFCSEACAALAILQTHLSRFCEEIVLWASAEFGFVELADQWSTGSSIMPQKKNPDYAELIRGKTGRVLGHLNALLAAQKGLPLAYNKDLQEDKEALFDALDTVEACLSMFGPMLESAAFKPERMRAAAAGGFANATDLADYLVRKGLPFRDAHAMAAAAVRACIDSGKDLAGMSLAEYRAICPLVDEDVYGEITLEACLGRRMVSGGPAPTRVLEQLDEIDRFAAGGLA